MCIDYWLDMTNLYYMVLLVSVIQCCISAIIDIDTFYIRPSTQFLAQQPSQAFYLLKAKMEISMF